MDDFADKHFNTDVMDCYNNRCTSRQKKEAQELLTRHAETPLAEVIEDFGKPSEEF